MAATRTQRGGGTLKRFSLRFPSRFGKDQLKNSEGGLDGIQLQSLALTTAVPEPASLALLGIGAVGHIGYGWRQRRRPGPPAAAG
jgi:hypothetical protein